MLTPPICQVFQSRCPIPNGASVVYAWASVTGIAAAPTPAISVSSSPWRLSCTRARIRLNTSTSSSSVQTPRCRSR